MWVFDHETLAFLEVNDAAVQHYGYSREEFLRMKLSDIRSDEELPCMVEYLHDLLSAKTPARMGLAGVWRHKKKDGTLIDVEIKWSPILFHGRAASLTMANDITERSESNIGTQPSRSWARASARRPPPPKRRRIIRAVADDLFHWDAFTLDLYSAEEERVYPILNVDTDREGRRFEIPVTGQGREPSRMARRIVTHGAELILREEPLSMPADVIPIGDVSRPSASLMLVPIRNRTKVIGILSIQSYTPKAYDRAASEYAANAGGPLRRSAGTHPRRTSPARERAALPRPVRRLPGCDLRRGL